MIKKIFVLILALLLLPSVLAGTVTRSFSSTTVAPNNQITVTYSADVSECTMEETIPSGWTADVTLYNQRFRHDFGSTTTLTRRYTAPSGISGSTFSGGQWWCPNGQWINFQPVTVTITSGGGSTTCSGSSSQSCIVDVGTVECAGTQTRTCSNGVWGNYGSCVKNDVNCGTTTGGCTVTQTQSYALCSNNGLYWYDNCNNKGSLKQSCSNGCITGDDECTATGGTTTPSAFEFGKCMSGNASTLPFKESLTNFDCFRISHLIIIIGIILLFVMFKK